MCLPLIQSILSNAQTGHLLRFKQMLICLNKREFALDGPLFYMGISTCVFNKCHLYEPEALSGLWVVQVTAKFCEKRMRRERKEKEKKGGGKERERKGKVQCDVCIALIAFMLSL